MTWLSDLWGTITTPQPPPTTLVVVLTAVGVVLLIGVPTLWHVTRHGLTIVHEAGHAFVAVLVGRRLSGIRVHSDTSGLTVSVGKPRGPGMVATALAGYLAPAAVGLAAAWFLSRGYAAGVLWGLLVLLVLVLLQIRNWYGLWSVLLTGALLVVVTLGASPQVQVGVALALTWFLVLGAPRAVLEMQAQRRRRRGRDTSDAGLLAELTHVPALAWAGVQLVLTLAALVAAALWLTGWQVTAA